MKVYEGGLYLPEKSSDASAIVADDEPMAVRMQFIYDGVTADKLTEAWTEGFEASGASGKSGMAGHINAFNALFDTEAKKGDVYQVSYVPGSGVTVSFNGVDKGTADGGLEFKQAVFGIWLGDKPADKRLKAGMLAG